MDSVDILKGRNVDLVTPPNAFTAAPFQSLMETRSTGF